MLYKPDLDEIVSRMEAWWRGEPTDRACIAVTAPNGRPRRELPAPLTPAERRTNIDFILDQAEAGMESTYYAGEAVPVFRPDLGPDAFSGLLGAELEFTETSSWARKCIDDWSTPPSFEIDRDSFEWKWHHEVYEAAAERAAGRFFLGAPDCHSGGDCLLAMRGGMYLCLDLYDHPEAVHAAMRKLERAVVEFHDAWWPKIESTGQRGHVTSWLSTWSPGRSQAVQLDLLALISPDQFRESFLHELEVQCDALDNAIFHLDGPDAVRSLPVLAGLLDVNRPGSALRAIQWVPGAGGGAMTKWIPLLKEIQSLGAGLHVACSPGEVEQLLRELSSRGLFINTGTRTSEEADALVGLAARLAHE